MAEKIPSSVRRESMGTLSLIIATFADLDDGDTWTSGLKGVLRYWFQDTANPTTQAAVGAAVLHTAGTFTFHPAEDNKAGDLFILQAG